MVAHRRWDLITTDPVQGSFVQARVSTNREAIAPDRYCRCRSYPNAANDRRPQGERCIWSHPDLPASVGHYLAIGLVSRYSDHSLAGEAGNMGRRHIAHPA